MNTVKFSKGVEDVFDQLKERDLISSWDIVTSLLATAPDMGCGVAGELVGHNPGGKDYQHLDGWIVELDAVTQGSHVNKLGLPELILCLCHIDPVTERFLQATGLLEVLVRDSGHAFEKLSATTVWKTWVTRARPVHFRTAPSTTTRDLPVVPPDC